MKPKPSRGDAKTLSIGALSRATQIPAETLRTWERRYGSPIPERKPSGHRLYSATQVERLRRVTRLLALGHRPGDILGLPSDELDRMLSIADPEEAATPDQRSIEFGRESLARSLAAALKAASDLDREALVRELRASWVRLGPLRFLEDFAGPFMSEIGMAWRSKALEVRHEHFASACLSGFLREVREPFDHTARGPRLAVATLSSDTHEGGLLMLSTLLAYRGYRVLYLGCDNPVEQIAAAATTRGIEIVAISISAAAPRRRTSAAVGRLRRMLPHRMPLWIGGAGAPVPPKGVERFENLEALDARLTG
ncbi:MAG: MerR family transcriptional regulator [Candidatus Eisenbacteria bacterium]|uniref:MerR family transcriptional regulator n=1 Tax=Eiseniibacteriota bacterium TaxID=2212470 RepID=A0A849SDY1_UNCEI|nr:MerR family transcriptional regulator [Candidatus Eisenbacteria bacterium]